MSNIFRIAEEEDEHVKRVKEAADSLHELIKSFGAKAPREIAIAKTHLETAIMWAVKGITTP